MIRKHIYRHRELRSWLSSLIERIEYAYRTAFVFPYRNLKAKKVAQIILPQEIDTYSLVKMLELFPSFPRNIPQLEQLVNQVKTESLNLPQPLDNNFQMVAKPLSQTENNRSN